MAKRSPDPVHCWLVWRKADEAARDYLYRGIEETGISDTDFRVLEALLHKGPLPVNTIGPKVHLTPGSISVAVDRLLEKALVSRAESSKDRRVRIVALTERRNSAECLPMRTPTSFKSSKAFSKRPASAPKRLATKEGRLGVGSDSSHRLQTLRVKRSRRQ